MFYLSFILQYNNNNKIQNKVKMNQSRSITVDNYKINKELVQQAYRDAQHQNKTYQVLAQTFRLMNLNNLYQSNPGDHTVKQAMKSIIDAHFISYQPQDNQTHLQRQMTELIPLNKVGNFGRILNRKCKIVDNGIMEFTDEKDPPKRKQIKTFVNHIQTFGSPQNDSKIEWYQESRKYPFRIILIDINDGHKAIYFPSLQKAQYTRMLLSQKFIFKGNFMSIIASCNKMIRDQRAQSFKQKLISRNKMMTKSSRFSRNINLIDKSQIKPESSIGRSQNIDNRVMGSTLGRLSESPAYSDKVLQCFQTVNDGYLGNFVETWFDFAKLKSSSLRNNFINPFPDSPSYIKPDTPSKMQPQTPPRTKPLAGYSPKVESNIRGSNVAESTYPKELSNSRLSQKYGYMTNTINQKKSQYRSKQSPLKDFKIDPNHKIQQLVFYSIQFLTLSNLFFKPIVTIQLFKNSRAEQYIIYNSVIKKKEPHLVYELLKSNPDDQLVLNSNIKEYQIAVKVIDFLANEEVITDKLSMKTKMLLTKNSILCDNKTIKLQFGPKSQGSRGQDLQVQAQRAQLKVPPLSDFIIQKINQYWEKESQYQGYYSQMNLSVYRILSQIDVVPLTWWKGLNENQYQLLHVIYCASRILNFKMIRSFVYLVKPFIYLYPNLDEFTQRILSFILTLMKVYYLPQHLNRIHKFHKMVGLDEDCELISKINFQIMIIQKIVDLECHSLADKLTRTNLSYGYILMEYIHEAFSRNFVPEILIQLWNYLYQDPQMLHLNMLLVCIALIKYYEQDLIKAKRLKDINQILQQKKIIKIQSIFQTISTLKSKYFGQTQGIIEQIKSIFNSKPLESVIYEYYRKETSKIDKRKRDRSLEKKSVMKKVNRQIDIQFPEYHKQHYTLHIYFSKLPDSEGSLTIRSNGIDYQCLNINKTRYFIIGQVANTLTLSFLDLKSNQYTCPLILNQGIYEHTATLTSTRNTKIHTITYIGGLLTDNQIDIFKKGKKFEHFLSPFIKKQEFLQEMCRPIHQTYFLRKYDSNSSRDDIIKRIKSIFCLGNKTFNELEFYLEQIQTSEMSLEEKFQLIKELSKQFSYQYCLSENPIFEKHLLYRFLESTGYTISPKEYECFYNDSLQYEFDAPKIVKCRYCYHSTKQLKLQFQAINYYIHKSTYYFYADIIIDELIQNLKPIIFQQIGYFAQGELKLTYSSNGQIFNRVWLFKQRANKDIYYQQVKESSIEEIEQRQIAEPQILMTEVLPSFAKISTILDYVNNNKSVDLRHKYQDKEQKKSVENINILKLCQQKFMKVITMKYLSHPKRYSFPFFQYYYELTRETATPVLKNILLDNLKTDLRSICLFKGNLKFGQNPKIQSFSYQDQLGLYGNLRKMSKDAKGWFFFGYLKDDVQHKSHPARVFVNYGYGIFRWQPCQVLGYYNHVKKMAKTKLGDSKMSESKSKPKKVFVILHQSQEKSVKEYQLQIRSQIYPQIEQLYDSSSRLSRSLKRNSRLQYQNQNQTLKYLSKFIK